MISHLVSFSFVYTAQTAVCMTKYNLCPNSVSFIMSMEKVTTNVKRTVFLSILMQFTSYLLESKNDDFVESVDEQSNFTIVTVVSKHCK